MRVFHSLAMSVALGIVGCHTQTEPEVPKSVPSGKTSEPSDPPPAPPVDEAPGPMVEVNTKETPVMRCGPKDSYHYVVDIFVCKNGSNPYKGNLTAGHDARIGNVGANSTGHIIDLYEVPCPEGPRRVYVDMYGCPGGKPGSAQPPPAAGGSI